MPAISMFYGIIVYLYYFDDERHKTPHIHVKYQEAKASFSIIDGSNLAGEFPIAQTRLIQAWIEIHRDALLADWELALEGKTVFPINPLN